MRYLLLIYGEAMAQESTPDTPSQRGRYDQEAAPWECPEALLPDASATTVRVRGERTIISDGPIVETREQLAGFCLLRCNDLDEAIECATRISSARRVSIEIRPVPEPDWRRSRN